MEAALRLCLASAKEVREGGPAQFPTVRGGGLQPGVDLDDSAALLSLMEQHE